MSYFEKKKEKEKDYKNHGPTPLEKCQFCDFSNRWKPISLCRTTPNTSTSSEHFYSAYFDFKKRISKITIFNKTHRLTTLEKCNIATCSKPCFYSLKKPVFLYRTSLNSFVRHFLNKKKEWEKLQF